MQRPVLWSALFGVLAIFISLASAMAQGSTRIDTPGLFNQPNLFAQPKLFTAPQPSVRMPKAPNARSMTGSQCRTLQGMCPIGRLEQVGDRCFCRTPKGAVLQGTTEIPRRGR